jgi:hypothetical protein
MRFSGSRCRLVNTFVILQDFSTTILFLNRVLRWLNVWLNVWIENLSYNQNLGVLVYTNFCVKLMSMTYAYVLDTLCTFAG